jgi:PTS system N-acetylglucosamine-specific IIC component
MGVFSGILIGCLSGAVYNRFNNTKLPSYLAFFGGKRTVPILMGLFAVVLAVVLAFIWPIIQNAINTFGRAVENSGNVGAFVFGTFNRLLVPVGLHMVLNSIFWFDLGSFTDAAGNIFRGDLFRYWAGDPTAGGFMTGFFPVMMFGLPAACLAMIVTAKKSRRAMVAGMLGSMALTSFLTGITEPIEFSFVFLAFPLYVIHSLLTGISLALTNLLGMRMGFNFSAGLIDYVLGYTLADKPLMLIPIGLAYGVVYFLLFVAVIKAFKLKTPGREDEDSTDEVAPNVSQSDSEWALSLIAGLGGKANIKFIDACATRLRVEVADNALVNEAALKAAKARGVMNKTQGSTQVVIGGEADHIAGVINTELKK